MAKGDHARLTHIGKYRLLARIGQGGMGTVYRATQESLDKIVALKVLAPSLARQADFVERFIREAQASGQLNHPNIVLGIDAGEADGFYYFAMEFVEGENLKAILDREGKLPERRALEITLAMAQALEHAHEHKIVHRDVKPGNILVTRDGTPKLADLGLAKEIRADHSITQAGIPVGTPFYISPEQIRGQQDIDQRADLYALGATLFHMVTGVVPYDGPTSAIVMTRHLNDPIPDPRANTPGLSEAAAAIIRHGMAKRREERYQNAKELREDIQAALAGRPPRHARKAPAHAPAAAQRLAERKAQEEARRRTLLIAGSVAGGVLLLVVVLALVLSGRRGTAVAPPPPPPIPSPPVTPRPGPAVVQPKVKATTASAVTPVAPKPSAEAVLRELLDYAASAEDRGDIEKRLREFSIAHAGSPAATKAKDRLAALRSEWSAEDEFKAAVRDEARQNRFAEALRKLDKPPLRGPSKRLDALVGELTAEVKRAASDHIAAEAAKAEDLVQKGEFQAALDLYRALGQLGLPEAKQVSDAAIKNVQKAAAEREQRLARRAFADLLVQAGPLVAGGKLDEARALFAPQDPKPAPALQEFCQNAASDLSRIGELFTTVEDHLKDLAAQNGSALIMGIRRPISKVENHVVSSTIGTRTFSIYELATGDLKALGCLTDPLQLPLLELYRGNTKKAKVQLDALPKEPADPLVTRWLQQIEWVEAIAREGEASDLLAAARKQLDARNWKAAADSLAQLTTKFGETAFVEKSRPAIQELSARAAEAIAAERREAETIRPFIDVSDRCGDLGKALKTLRPVGGWILDIDHDKEGLLDIAVDIRHAAGGDQLVPIFLNETKPGGELSFREATKEADLETGNEPLCWADFDGDGDLDAVYRGLRTAGEGPWAKDHAKLAFYENRCDEVARGKKKESFFRHLPTFALSPELAKAPGFGGFGFGNIAVLDANGDGRSDILAQYVAGNVKTLCLFLAVPGKPFVFADGSLRAGFYDRKFTIPEHLQFSAWPQYVVFDCDGDGRADFLVNADAGLVFRNKGGGVFECDSKKPLDYQTFVENQSPRIMPAVADYDNDGQMDIFVPQKGRNLLLRGEGGGRFTDAMPTTGPMAKHEDDSLWATWGDVNNDGLLDLFVCNAGTRNRLYIQMPNHAFMDKAPEYGVTGEMGEKTNFAAFGDLDRDGDLDMLILRDDGHSQVLLNPLIKADNHYSLSVVVRAPLGAMGAKVYLARPPDQLIGLQQIGRVEGYNRQTPPEAFFGVAAPGEYLVRVVLSNSDVVRRTVTVDPRRPTVVIIGK